jgi:hypothetical protein
MRSDVEHFTDETLKVRLRLQEPWDQRFVDKHGQEKHAHGQAKLLWSNLLGLALVEEHMQAQKDNRQIQLVVAGASPGTHMLVLLEHVKQWRESRRVQIHLYDPKALDKHLLDEVSNDSSMYFRRQTFEDADARDWQVKKGDDCLVFLSDIRSDIHDKNEHMHADEAIIAADMQAQQSWVKLMQPDYCMLKFHAPHATRDNHHMPKSFWYMSGDLYEQGYVGLFSGEHRLFCTRNNIRQQHVYEPEKLERHSFFHTYVWRRRTFSVHGKHMQYDEAFAAHVAHKAARVLGLDANALLHDANALLHVSPMNFAWPAAQMSLAQALHCRMLQIL